MYILQIDIRPSRRLLSFNHRANDWQFSTKNEKLKMVWNIFIHRSFWPMLENGIYSTTPDIVVFIKLFNSSL